MLSLAGSRLDDRNPLLGAKCMQAAGECSGHLTQVLVIQVRVVAVQLPPQAAHAAAGLPRTADQVRVCDQYEDGEGARTDRTLLDATARRRDHRVSLLSLLHLLRSGI